MNDTIIIETERLLLRALLPSDDKAMFRLDSNPAVHQFLGNNPIISIEESQKQISHIRNQYIKNGIGRYAVILKETNQFIGWCGLKFITEIENNHIDFYEIGYRFIEEYWAKGYGSESANAWINYGFKTMKIKMIYASANIKNTGSRKILKKIGMQEKNQFIWNGISCIWYELENKMI